MLGKWIFLLVLFAYAVMVSCGRRGGKTTTSNDDELFFGLTTTTPPPSYTYDDRLKCQKLCELKCTMTYVFMNDKQSTMFNCLQLKQTQKSFMDSISSGAFQGTLIGLLFFVIISVFLIMCVYYCCFANRKKIKKYGEVGREEFIEVAPKDERIISKNSAVIQC